MIKYSPVKFVLSVTFLLVHNIVMLSSEPSIIQKTSDILHKNHNDIILLRLLGQQSGLISTDHEERARDLMHGSFEAFKNCYNDLRNIEVVIPNDEIEKFLRDKKRGLKELYKSLNEASKAYQEFINDINRQKIPTEYKRHKQEFAKRRSSVKLVEVHSPTLNETIQIPAKEQDSIVELPTPILQDGSISRFVERIRKMNSSSNMQEAKRATFDERTTIIPLQINTPGAPEIIVQPPTPPQQDSSVSRFVERLRTMNSSSNMQEAEETTIPSESNTPGAPEIIVQPPTPPQQDISISRFNGRLKMYALSNQENGICS